jgi:hypothetical protein
MAKALKPAERERVEVGEAVNVVGGDDGRVLTSHETRCAPRLALDLSGGHQTN